MTKLDPTIAVKDVEVSSNWYQTVFNCKSIHDGNHFDILTINEEVLICLHKWGEHDHSSMKDSTVTPGNGLILYLRTEKIKEIRTNLRNLNYPVESEILLNPNSNKNEFSVRDLDGYCWIISEAHNYQG